MKDRGHPGFSDERGLVIGISIDACPPRDGETAYRNLDPACLAMRPKTEIFAAVKEEPTDDVHFKRFSARAMDELRNLPLRANIVLLTPVLVPAGNVEAYNKQPNMDPFEPFGRELSKHHAQIRHVPYPVSYGFTETHEAFINEADAVIVLICKPHSRNSLGKLESQRSFAEEALQAIQSRGEGSRALPAVLIKCCNNLPASWQDPAFANIVESSTFNDEIARELAHMIFKDTY